MKALIESFNNHNSGFVPTKGVTGIRNFQRKHNPKGQFESICANLPEEKNQMVIFHLTTEVSTSEEPDAIIPHARSVRGRHE